MSTHVPSEVEIAIMKVLSYGAYPIVIGMLLIGLLFMAKDGNDSRADNLLLMGFAGFFALVPSTALSLDGTLFIVNLLLVFASGFVAHSLFDGPEFPEEDSGKVAS